MKDEAKQMRLLKYEVESLISEGYFILFAAQTMGCKEFVKMRHNSNGNVMRITLKDSQITLMKNGKIVKQYEV